MEEVVRLLSALTNADRYGDVSQRQIAYIPDGGKLTLKRGDTGMKAGKSIDCEDAINWYPFITPDEDVYIIGASARNKLSLRGKNGYINCLKFAREYSQLYNCKRLDAMGIPITESIFKQMPKFHKRLNDKFCLADDYKNLHNDVIGFGMKYVSSGEVKGKVMYTCYGEESDYSYILVPLVKLSLNTMVEISPFEEDRTIDGKELKIFMPTD